MLHAAHVLQVLKQCLFKPLATGQAQFSSRDLGCRLHACSSDSLASSSVSMSNVHHHQPADWCSGQMWIMQPRAQRSRGWQDSAASGA